MCVGPFKSQKPKSPPPPPPPPPQIDDQAVIEAAEKKRRRAAEAFGARDTIITGSMGAALPQTQQKTAYGA